MSRFSWFNASTRADLLRPGRALFFHRSHGNTINDIAREQEVNDDDGNYGCRQTKVNAPGTAMGNIILWKIPNSLAPSMRPASISSVRTMDSRYCFPKKTAPAG